MKLKAIAGSTLAATLMGVGVLAGSVIGNTTASAQTPSVTPSATVTAPALKDRSTAADPATGAPAGRQGGFGGPGGGRGHGGGGDFGGRCGYSRRSHPLIANATSSIASVNTDLTYATGKMDTAQVQEWLNGAAALLKSAEAANTASQFGQANAYATAASELARAADSWNVEAAWRSKPAVLRRSTSARQRLSHHNRTHSDPGPGQPSPS